MPIEEQENLFLSFDQCRITMRNHIFITKTLCIRFYLGIRANILCITATTMWMNRQLWLCFTSCVLQTVNTATWCLILMKVHLFSSMTSIASTHKCSLIAFSAFTLPFMNPNVIRYVFEENHFFDWSSEISQPTTSVGGQGNAKFKLQSSTFNAYFTKMNSKCVNICFFFWFIYGHTFDCCYLCKCVFV